MGWISYYCAICSCPFDDPSDTWRLAGPHYTADTWLDESPPASGILVHLSSAVFFNGTDFAGTHANGDEPYPPELGEQGQWFMYDSGGDGFGHEILPVHDVCMEMAQRMMGCERIVRKGGLLDARVSPLYEAMHVRDRLKELKMVYELGNTFINRRHGGYGASQFCDQDWAEVEGWEWLLADPIVIPGLTDFIISTITAGNYTATTVSPTGATTSSYQPLSQSQSQTFWRDRLFSGDAIPWLWDLDSAALSPLVSDKEYDWQKLCTDLCAPVFDREEQTTVMLDAAESGGYEKLTLGDRKARSAVMRDAPEGLWNRRRVWRILEDLRLYMSDGPTSR